MDFIGNLGASLIATALRVTCLFGSVALTAAVYSRLFEGRAKARWAPVVGFVLWLAIFLGLGFLLEPAAHVLDSYACRDADDFEWCMERSPPGG